MLAGLLNIGSVGSMTDVVTAILADLNSTSIFSVVGELVPFIVMIVPVALGLYFLRKLINGAGKAKVRF